MYDDEKIYVSDKHRIINGKYMHAIVDKIRTVEGLRALETYLIGEIKQWIGDEILSRQEVNDG